MRTALLMDWIADVQQSLSGGWPGAKGAAARKHPTPEPPVSQHPSCPPMASWALPLYRRCLLPLLRPPWRGVLAFCGCLGRSPSALAADTDALRSATLRFRTLLTFGL
jgi:hypothetical protein